MAGMPNEQRPSGRVASSADELEGVELDGTDDRPTPLPPTDPDPPRQVDTEGPPAFEAPAEPAPAVLGAPGDPAGAIMISAPQRAAAPGFWPFTPPTPPPQGAASGFWPRK